MGITHTFQSTITNSTDATKVRPSNWNAEHEVDGLIAVTTPTSVPSGFGGAIYDMCVFNDTLDASSITFLQGLSYVHTFGGPTVTGGRQAGRFYLRHNGGATSTGNTNRNYVALTAHMITDCDDTGLDLVAPKGAYFAFNPIAVATSGAANLAQLAGMEVNIETHTGCSINYKAGITITAVGSVDQVRGSTFDCMLSLSNQVGAVGWNDGVLFSTANGEGPIHSSGSLIRTQGAGTVANGVDISSYTITGNAFASPNFRVEGSGTVYSGTGLVRSEEIATLVSSYVLTDSTGSQKLLNASTNGALTAGPNKSYFFECGFNLNNLSTVAGTVGFGFGGTANITAQSWHAMGLRAAATSVPSAPTYSFHTAATTALFASSSLAQACAEIKGKLTITTSGTVIPQVFIGSSAPTGAPAVEAGAYFKIYPIGTNTATTVGGWS